MMQLHDFMNWEKNNLSVLYIIDFKVTKNQEVLTQSTRTSSEFRVLVDSILFPECQNMIFLVLRQTETIPYKEKEKEIN